MRSGHRRKGSGERGRRRKWLQRQEEAQGAWKQSRGVRNVYPGGGRPEGLERADGLEDSRRSEGPEVKQEAKQQIWFGVRERAGGQEVIEGE